MSTHSTTDRLAAARAVCDLLEQERQRRLSAVKQEQQRKRESKEQERQEKQRQREVAKEQEQQKREQQGKARLKLARSYQDFVYIISASNGYCKIGISHDPKRRFRELQREAATWAITLELIHVIPTNKAYILEQSLHKQFAAQRVIGEWFLLASDDLKWLKKQ